MVLLLPGASPERTAAEIGIHSGEPPHLSLLKHFTVKPGAA
jgi:hypothetical protein